MKFYALYFVNPKTIQTAKDELFQTAKRNDFFFVPVPHPADLPDTLKKQNVGITRWGFYCIARSDKLYTLEQLQQNISALFFYEELKTEEELKDWFNQHCKILKIQLNNPMTGKTRVVTKVTTVPADTERRQKEWLETVHREIHPTVKAYKFYEREFIKKTDPTIEKTIDFMIQLQHDYNEKIQSRYESYWYNKRKGFDYMYTMLKDGIIPDLALDYVAYIETLLNKTTRTAMELAVPIMNEAERQCPAVWMPDKYGYERPDFEHIKQFLVFLIRKKLKDTGVEFIFDTPEQYISYLNLNWYIDPEPQRRQQISPLPTKKPRIVYPPGFKH